MHSSSGLLAQRVPAGAPVFARTARASPWDVASQTSPSPTNAPRTNSFGRALAIRFVSAGAPGLAIVTVPPPSFALRYVAHEYPSAPATPCTAPLHAFLP